MVGVVRTKAQFFLNQLRCEKEGISKGTRNENDKHTKTVDPKKAASPLPLLEHITLCKPCGSATVMCFASDVMVRPRIWRGQPTSNILLQLVTCKVDSAYTSQNDDIVGVRTFHLVDFHCYLLHHN